MGKKVRVFIWGNEAARLSDSKNCKPSDQKCFFCDLLDCKDIQRNGEKMRVGTVKLFGKPLSIYFSPQEGCWLPVPA
jgi:hypothetical protein